MEPSDPQPPSDAKPPTCFKTPHLCAHWVTVKTNVPATLVKSSWSHGVSGLLPNGTLSNRLNFFAGDRRHRQGAQSWGAIENVD